MATPKILQWANPKGEFIRKDAQFRNTVSSDPSAKFPAQPNRYHLYISLACPWAHRTLIFLKLKKLEHVIGLSIVDHLLGQNGWEFTDRPGTIPDTVNGVKYLKELYFMADPAYDGRFTVPVLWDTVGKTIVNNESSEIIRILNSAFNEWAGAPGLDLYPEKLRPQIDTLNETIYHGLNNGVYKAGFATSQEAYATNAKLVNDTLEKVEVILANNKFVIGDTLTETDIRLFTTIIRFDPVYYGHFKCNLRAMREYPGISRWMKMIYDLDGISGTVNMAHIKKHYYESHLQINPTGVVPLYNGPLFEPDST